jgi:hypothetical protein
MPSSREVRARQNRQKERVAAQLAERRRAQRRRRRMGGVAGVILLVIVVAVGLAVGGNAKSNNDTVTISPTSAEPTTTTTVLKSVKGKPCVGLKDPLPKGSPAILLSPGPAPTKLLKQDLKVGTGKVVPKDAKVSVDYVLVACTTGRIIDSTYVHNQTFDADLSASAQLIAGWRQGIPGMKVGGTRLLAIPSALAYGATGKPGIAPFESLFFLIVAEKLA